MDLDKRLQRLQGSLQTGLDGKPFGYGTFLPMNEGGSKIPNKRSREHQSQTTNSHIPNQQMRNNQSSHASVTTDPTNDDATSQIPSNSAETTSPSKIIQVMTIPLGPLLSPFVSVANSREHNQVQQQSDSAAIEENTQTKSEQPIESVPCDASNPSESTNTEKVEDQNHEDQNVSKLKGASESEVQQSVTKQDENNNQQLPKADKEKRDTEHASGSKSQTPEITKEKIKEKSSVQELTNEKGKDRKSKSNDKQRTEDKKSKDREESKEKKQEKKSKDSRTKDKKSKKSQEKELDKKKDKRDQTRTRSASRSSSRSRSRERDRGRNYDRDRDYKEKRRRRSYSYSSDNGNSSSPSRSRYSSSDSERDYDSRKRRRKGKSRSRSRSRSRDRKDRERKDRDRSKNKKRKRSKSRDRGTGKSAEDTKKPKPGATEISSDITNLSAINMKDASLIAEECKKNATKLKHVADKLSDKSQAGEIYFQSGLQFLACAHAYEEGNMHDKAVMMYQQTGTFFESIAKMYSHDEKFKVLVSMCCKCVAVALSRRFILDPSRLRQLHADLSTPASTNTSNSTTNTGTPNRSPSSSGSTSQTTSDPSPPQVVSTSPSLPAATSNTERSASSSSNNTSQNHSAQPTVRLKGERQQNMFDIIKCFEMWGRAEKNLAIQHFSMTNVKELIQSLTQYAKTNLTPSSANQDE